MSASISVTIAKQAVMSQQEPQLSPDDVIHELGGCGRFQLRMAILVHLMKTITCWSLTVMVFVTAIPPWRCIGGEINGLETNYSHSANASVEPFGKSCTTQNGTKCSRYEFSTDMRTMINEWEFVCDRAWIPATILTIQVGCQLFGNFFAGHIADAIGRKIPFFMSLVIMMFFNLLSYFSVSWIMFTICRIFIGIGTGCFLTIQYSYLSEFSLARWRTWLIGFPSWPMQSCVLALILWLLKDWRNAHLVIALAGIPFLAAWWFIPESFRWYYAHDRIDDAERVVSTVSKVNRRPLPDMTYMKQLVMMDSIGRKKDRKYSALDLFKTRFLMKVTLLLSVNWVALGLITYGITFGITRLSGSIYLNLFLFKLVQIPSKSIAIWLQNRFGRRPTSILVFVVTGTAAMIVGIVQYIDTDRRDSLTNGFAMMASLGIATAWGPVQTMTIETYPTVIRNIGFGFCSVLARVGAAVGPQLVFLDIYVPGILYFICGGTSIVCICALFWLPETKDSNLNDKINQVIKHERITNGIK